MVYEWVWNINKHGECGGDSECGRTSVQRLLLTVNEHE